MITAISTNRYEWDAADRLVAINIGLNRSEFMYDGLGRRVRIVEKTNGIVQSDKRFLWCGLELCEERDSTGASVTKRFFAQESRFRRELFICTRSPWLRARVDRPAGTIRARYEYDPYGRQPPSAGTGNVDADFGFTGLYFHASSGLSLQFFRATMRYWEMD